MSSSESPNPFIALIKELGIQLDAELLELALTHRSYAYENGQIPHNERLEFLGDSVLGINVTDYLYRAFPDFPEGRLAKVRASVVSAVSLGEVARALAIGRLIKLGHGELTTGGRDKTSILADTTEALIGAIYLTEPAGAALFVHHIFDPLVDRAVRTGAGLDWKTSLQEMCAWLGAEPPEYEIEEFGPDHDKHFVATAVAAGRRFNAGKGHNKKQAEQRAAEYAFKALKRDCDRRRAGADQD
ncbi:ribonuclease III [uncultured Propionibacterium sp.]|uniref:ribonuclease III n=1 Tax=uncultured Propionibacterium sp. TaxID=218066 RepID=UPI00292D7123|nr:ribonuclease III [uncultured Propionibacterium sp.]